MKKGDVLATFDASSLSGKLSERRTAYNEALKTYNHSLTAASEAKAKLPQVNKEIKELEAKVEKLTKEARIAEGAVAHLYAKGNDRGHNHTEHAARPDSGHC